MKSILKKLYAALPFKQQIFSAMKFFWSPPRSVYQHLHFNGLITVTVTDKTSFKIIHHGKTIENDLFWKGLLGSWEKNAMQCWIDLCSDSPVIFDIGANTGVYSLVAKTVNPAAEVHAFEPFGAICDKLKKNIAINNFEVKVNCAAVSDYTGDAVIYSEDPEFAYSVTVNKNLWVKDKEATKHHIKTTTLKDYITQHSIQRIDLMKIDVETHEPEVMAGFGEYYNIFKPIILIEVLNDEVVTKLNEYFSPAAHYHIYHIHEKKGLQQAERFFTHEFYNFLVVPVEKASLIKK